MFTAVCLEQCLRKQLSHSCVPLTPEHLALWEDVLKDSGVHAVLHWESWWPSFLVSGRAGGAIACAEKSAIALLCIEFVMCKLHTSTACVYCLRLENQRDSTVLCLSDVGFMGQDIFLSLSSEMVVFTALYFEIIWGWQLSCQHSTAFPYFLSRMCLPITIFYNPSTVIKKQDSHLCYNTVSFV